MAYGTSVYGTSVYDAPTYTQAVDALPSPLYNWKLGETVGSGSVADRKGNYPVNLTVDTGATLGTAGLLAGNNSGNTAATLNGTATGDIFGASGSRPTISNTRFAWVAYIKVDATNTLTGIQYICALTGSGTDHSGICLNGNKVEGFFQVGGSYVTADSATSVVAGGTYRVSCSYDGANLVTRINGVTDATTPSTATPNTGIGFSAVIGSDWALTQRFKGVVDEVAFYNQPLPQAKDLAEHNASQPAASARTGSDTVTISDAATRTAPRTRTSSDTVTVSDSAAGTAAAASYNSVLDTDSVYAHWKLGSDLVDRINARNLTTSSGITQGATSLVANNGSSLAASLAGAGYAYRSSSTEFTGNAGFSVEAWVKPTASPGTAQTFVFKGDGTVNWLWGLTLNPGGTVEFYVQTTAQYTYQRAQAAGAWVSGGTYHVVGTYDPAVGAKVYVNGVVGGTAPGAFTMFHGSGDDSAPIAIGSEITQNFLTGSVDEVAYYTTALSSTRVSAHYTIGSSGGPTSLTRSASDSVSVSDAATRLVSTARTGTDSVTVSDSAAGVRGITRSATDSVSVSDAATRAATARTRTASDTVTVSDSTAPTSIVATYPHPNRLPSPVTYPSAGTISNVTASASDSVSVSDVATRATIARTRTTTDSVSASDAATRVLSDARTASETVAVSDAATRTRSTPRTAVDTVAVSDAATRATIARVRASVDTVAASDAATRLVSTARTTSDSVSVSDAAVGGSGRSRAAADTITVADATTRILGTSRTGSDTVAVSEVATRAALARTRSTADTVSVGDVATVPGGSGSLTRSASDSVTVSDAATRLVSDARAAVDTVAVSDAVTRVRAGGRSTTDSVVVADTASRISAAARSATDSVTVSDSAAGIRVVTRFASDTVAVSETATRAALTRTRATSDVVAVSEAATRSITRARTTADSVSVTDAAVQLLQKGRAALDAVTVLDHADRTPMQAVRFATDTITVSDVAVGVFTPFIAPLLGIVVEGGGGSRFTEDGKGSGYMTQDTDGRAAQTTEHSDGVLLMVGG